MSIASEKRDIRQNVDSLEWLLFTQGCYFREESELTRLSNNYSYRTELGKALIRRKRVALELRDYIGDQIRKHHVKEENIGCAAT